MVAIVEAIECILIIVFFMGSVFLNVYLATEQQNNKRYIALLERDSRFWLEQTQMYQADYHKALQCGWARERELETENAVLRDQLEGGVAEGAGEWN